MLKKKQMVGHGVLIAIDCKPPSVVFSTAEAPYNKLMASVMLWRSTCEVISTSAHGGLVLIIDGESMIHKHLLTHDQQRWHNTTSILQSRIVQGETKNWSEIRSVDMDGPWWSAIDWGQPSDVRSRPRPAPRDKKAVIAPIPSRFFRSSDWSTQTLSRNVR